jgi:hypothetical protein
MQLARNDDGNVEFLCQRLDAAGDVGDLLLSILCAARSRMEQFQVVNHENVDHRPGAGTLNNLHGNWRSR